jgi:DNA-binding MarR family transcriptional regulator
MARRPQTVSRGAGDPAEGEPVGRTASPVDISPLPERVGYVLRRAQLAVFKDFNRTCAEFDIRPAQYSVLTVIENNPGLKQIEISTALGIKRTNLVALLDLLEQRGLARREPVPSDRRSYALFLTSKGKAFMDRVHASVTRHEDNVNGALGDKGREQLLQLLNRILEKIGPAPAEDEV